MFVHGARTDANRTKIIVRRVAYAPWYTPRWLPPWGAHAVVSVEPQAQLSRSLSAASCTLVVEHSENSPGP